jgi:hypothetical protein
MKKRILSQKKIYFLAGLFIQVSSLFSLGNAAHSSAKKESSEKGIIRKIASKAVNEVKGMALNVYEGSQVMQRLTADRKEVTQGLKSAHESFKKGKVGEATKKAVKTWYPALNLATGGESSLIVNVFQNYGDSLVNLKKGNRKEAIVQGKRAAIDSLRFAAGPGLNMVIAPKSTADLDNAARGVGKSVKEIAQSTKDFSHNLFKEGNFQTDDFRKVVEKGKGVQDSLLNLAATSVTNLDVGRKAIKGVGSYGVNGLQNLGMAAVETTGSGQYAYQGEYKKALNSAGKAAIKTGQGGGQLASLVIIGAQMTPVLGQTLAVPLAIAGSAANLAGNTEEILGGSYRAGKGVYSGIKKLKEGNKKEGWKDMGKAGLEGGMVTGLVVADVVGGGAFGKVIGRGMSTGVSTVTSKGAGVLGKVALKAGAKGVGVLGKVLSKGPKPIMWAGGLLSKSGLRDELREKNKEAAESSSSPPSLLTSGVPSQ